MPQLKRVLVALAWLLCSLPAMPGSAEPLPVLRVEGSNTIGTSLIPALLKGLFQARGLEAVSITSLGATNEWRVDGRYPLGAEIEARIAAHGSATGFLALAKGTADLAASSRPIHPLEQAELYGEADPALTGTEHVIGIDGVAVIVPPGNPLRSLDAAQLADVFAGTLTQWEQLGLPLGPIHLYARDNRSGTWETFRDLLLAPRELSLRADAVRLESSEELSSAVSHDPQAIGFIGLPYVHQNRALAIGDGEAQPLPPSTDTVATEDYLLSRRLYLYAPASGATPWAGALTSFAQSDAGQRVVAEQGFVAQQIHPVSLRPTSLMPAEYRALAAAGQRLTVNFRFAGSSASLDSKAMADLERLASYLRSRPGDSKRLVLVGFGDAKSDPGRAELLSRLRAMTVRRELARRGVLAHQVLALGALMPVASNAYETGRARNRRVEVWLQ